MEFPELVVKMVKKYLDDAGLPKKFKSTDGKDFKLYLSFQFALDLAKAKPKDLTDKDRCLYETVKVYKQYVNNSVYKEVLNWGRLEQAKDAEDIIIQIDEMAKKGGKKKKGKFEVVKLKTSNPPVKFIRKKKKKSKEGFFARIGNAIKDTAFGASLALNDWLISH